MDKESVGLDNYNIIRIANRDGSFYRKEDVIAVEGDTLYWQGLHLIKYCWCLHLIKSLIKCVTVCLIGYCWFNAILSAFMG